MKKVFLFLLVIVSFVSYGQDDKYVGEYHSKMNLNEGLISSIVFSKDSFLFTCVFTPKSYYANLKTDRSISYKKTSFGTPNFFIPDGSAVKIYRGSWHIDNNAGDFNTNGWDFSYMDNYNNDSVYMKKLHFTSKDGDRVVMKFNDGNTFYGLLSASYTPYTTTFFWDYFFSSIYIIKGY